MRGLACESGRSRQGWRDTRTIASSSRIYRKPVACRLYRHCIANTLCPFPRDRRARTLVERSRLFLHSPPVLLSIMMLSTRCVAHLNRSVGSRLSTHMCSCPSSLLLIVDLSLGKQLWQNERRIHHRCFALLCVQSSQLVSRIDFWKLSKATAMKRTRAFACEGGS